MDDKNFEKFNKFRAFWNKEVKKIFFRYSKEYGIYNKIKITLNPNNKQYWDDNFYEIYARLVNILMEGDEAMIDFNATFKSNNIKRKYCVKTALKDNRHLSQFLIYFILARSNIKSDVFEKIFIKIDKELFKGHKINAFLIEKWYLITLYFRNL